MINEEEEEEENADWLFAKDLQEYSLTHKRHKTKSFRKKMPFEIFIKVLSYRNQLVAQERWCVKVFREPCSYAEIKKPELKDSWHIKAAVVRGIFLRSASGQRFSFMWPTVPDVAYNATRLSEVTRIRLHLARMKRELYEKILDEVLGPLTPQVVLYLTEFAEKSFAISPYCVARLPTSIQTSKEFLWARMKAQIRHDLWYYGNAFGLNTYRSRAPLPRMSMSCPSTFSFLRNLKDDKALKAMSKEFIANLYYLEWPTDLVP